jgi:DNA-binding response OmpR family regulator
MTVEPGHAEVLVADDEPHLLRLVKFRLEREGYEVLTAVDGEAALELARSERPDLCVLDVMMPSAAGLTCCASSAATIPAPG